MLQALTSLFSTPRYQEEAHQLYTDIVSRSRNSVLYSEYGVADTLDGRFDMIILHMALLSERLKRDENEETIEFLRVLTEAFFADMDRNLREMGSTDTGVGKRVKKMSQAFFGRIFAYQEALDQETMQAALLRNVYRDDASKAPHALKLADYVHAQREALATTSLDDLLQGKLN